MAARQSGAVIASLRRATGGVRAWQVWTLREPLRGYIVSVPVLAVVVASFAAARTTWRISDAAIFTALIACGIIAIESTRSVREIHGVVRRDLQTVWYLAIATSLPPAYALLAPVPLTIYKLWRIRRGFAYRTVFSNATISLAYGCASLAFHAIPASIAGARPGTATHALTWTSVLVGCGVMAWAINNGLLLAAIKMADPGSRVVRNQFGNREAVVSDMIELSLAVSLSLVVAINPVLMALALPSVVLYRRYLMHAQLVALARIDAKTGLLNAGTWQHEAEVELFRALRSRTSLAIAMVDIDDFKAVMGSVGPLVADQLLRDIAGMLRDQLPEYNLIGRFVGEEFAILLPQTGQEEARRLSERLRDHIAGEPIAVESGDQAGFVFRLTVSIGVAVLNESRRALGELIGAADSALSQAKSTGWNKVCVLNGGSEPQDS
jgi:diguanylate cyclase (GGDEF)-like protein